MIIGEKLISGNWSKWDMIIFDYISIFIGKIKAKIEYKGIVGWIECKLWAKISG